MKRSTRPPMPIAARSMALAVLLAGATACGTQQQAGDASPGIPVTESVHTDRAFERALIDATRDYILHAMRAHGTPGLNLAMVYRGELIWEAGFGWADAAAGKPMT
ncbi:MAG: serine hydrolase, partial [Gemmatimonadetes bacterium]|nr:serine hydrolase [Gemmatimonadota bacterium]